MLVVSKYQKIGSAFKTVEEALADANSKFTEQEVVANTEFEASALLAGVLSQPVSNELVGDTLIAVFAASRMLTKTETEYIIFRDKKFAEAGWIKISAEVDGKTVVVNNGRFFINDFLVPFYPE